MFVGIVLAAGVSTRMGTDKALLAYPEPLPEVGRGEATFLEACVRKLLTACAAVEIVLGHNSAEIVHRSEAALAGLPVRWRRNPDYERGQFSSLCVGASAALDEAGCEAAFVALVDRPGFAPATLDALRAAATPAAALIAKPEYAGRHGHPVLYRREVLAAVVAAPPEGDMREVARRFAQRTVAVPVADDGILRNVDTPEDYRLFKEAASERVGGRAQIAARPTRASTHKIQRPTTVPKVDP